ncbi:MAG TPA: ATP-binding protein, partial [Candidatus Synoicihabitans sp.]|nr:ATP-binding protein [Candidatus Synoicihabitans sp.]
DRVNPARRMRRVRDLDLELDASSLDGRHVSEVIGDAAYAVIGIHLDAAIEGRRVEFEVEIPYATHTPRWVYAVHEPERNAAGDVVGVVAVVTDITERKLAEQEIMLARDRALAASRAKDDFLARLSHELRTPLNPVLLIASDAASNSELPENVRADFEMIAANVALEARLIDDLLDLTRIARGKMMLELRPLDVHPIIRDACSMVQADVAKKGLRLELKLEAREAFIMADDVRLKQVFWNVLQNAVKFTAPDGHVVVETSLQPLHDRLSVRVRDTGIGMSAMEIERVFEAFEQGDHAAQGGANRFGGLGLGLAISRMLVQLHSGTIRARSDGIGQGTEFSIELPLLRLADEPEGVKRVRPSTVQARPALKSDAPRPTRILLVEDHTPTRLALANLLIRRHCEVVTAGDVTSARALVQQGAFDLLISDIGLPDGNGCDLMSEFRRQYGLPGIALTGYGSAEDVTRSETAGFATHLTKPVSMQALDGALVAALQLAGK